MRAARGRVAGTSPVPVQSRRLFGREESRCFVAALAGARLRALGRLDWGAGGGAPAGFSRTARRPYGVDIARTYPLVLRPHQGRLPPSYLIPPTAFAAISSHGLRHSVCHASCRDYISVVAELHRIANGSVAVPVISRQRAARAKPAGRNCLGRRWLH